MKVCILTSAHPPLDGRIFYKEAQSLKQAGYEVVVIGPHGQDERVAGIQIRAVSRFSSRVKRVMGLRTIYRLAKAEQADIYHFHDPDLILPGLMLQHRLHKPVVYDVHEYYADSMRTKYWIPQALRKGIAGIFDLLEKRAARSFAGIVTVNNHMSKLFQRENNEVIVLHNYPLESQFDLPRPEEVRSPQVLYLGAMNQERGLEVILQAMEFVRERHPEVSCQLVGSVNTNGLAPEFQALEEWAERGNIVWRGKVGYQEVPAILQNSTVALVPLLPTLNYQKAIPVKLLEYMAAGLPVVGSRFGYIETIITENECGRLCEPGNPRELADGIIYFLEHPLEALRCGQQGWEAFHREYTWEREQGKLLGMYERLLGYAGKGA